MASEIISVDVQRDGYIVSGPASAALGIARLVALLEKIGSAKPNRELHEQRVRMECVTLACRDFSDDSDAAIVARAERFWSFVKGAADA